MALRVSRQLVEILSKGTGVLRVSRQLVEILAKAGAGDADSEITITDTATYRGSMYYSASNALTITDAAALGSLYTVGTEDSITIAQTATYTGSIYVSASNSLIITSIADQNGIARDVDDPITVTDIASYTLVQFNISITQPITITQVASFTGPQYVSASNSITVTSRASASGTINVTASDSLIVSEEVFDPDTSSWSTVTTGIEQVASQLSTANRSIYHYVGVTDAAFAYVSHSAKWIPKAATDTLTITDQAAEVTVEDVVDSIVIISTASFLIVDAASDSITITDTADLVGVYNLAASDTLIIHQAHTYELYREGTLCTYSPFIGNSSSIEVLPPRPTTPTITHYPNIELTYPVIGPTDTLTLRGPELRNRNNLQFQRINRETRGGTLIIYADPIWPEVETMILEFIGLSEAESQAALSFVSTSLGKMIRIRDWEGRVWVGSITTPDDPIIRNGKGCQNTLALTLDVDSTYAWDTYDGFDWDAFIGDDWNVFLGE